RNYVPIILAMNIMSKNPSQYGLDSLQLEPPEKYDVVRVSYPVDLRLVAECVDAPVEELVDLNPSLLRRVTPKDQPFDLHVPHGTKEKYEPLSPASPPISAWLGGITRSSPETRSPASRKHIAPRNVHYPK